MAGSQNDVGTRSAGDFSSSRKLLYCSTGLGHKWLLLPVLYAIGLSQFTTLQTELYVQNDSTLLLVFTLSRHGDRSPVHQLPDDPYLDHWSKGLEELTTLGVRQLWDLGEFVRRYYGPFIPETYHKDAFFFRSSGTDRTLQSASSFAAGLFHTGMTDAAVSGDTIALLGPVPMPPVHSMPTRNDRLLKMSSQCPAAKRLVDQLLNSPLASNEVRKYQQTIRALLSRYPQMFPPLPDPSRLLLGSWKICDPLIIWTNHDLPGRPRWLTQEIYRDCERLLDFKQWLRFSTASATRLHGGPLVAHFLRTFRARADAELMATGRRPIGTQLPAPHGTEMLVNVSARQRLVSYFAHDSTLAAVMSHLDIFDRRKPPLASTLIVELHEVHQNTRREENSDDGGTTAPDPFHVRFLYRNFAWPMADQSPVVLWPPACGQKPLNFVGTHRQSHSLCSLAQLEAAVFGTYALSETDECSVQSHWFTSLMHTSLFADQFVVQFLALLISQAILLCFLSHQLPVEIRLAEPE